MKPLGSLNLQGFFVFRIVQFSRYRVFRSCGVLFYSITSFRFCQPFFEFFQILFWGDFVSSVTALISYHGSRGFLNFFKVFWAPDSWYQLPLEAAYLAYHISFGLSSTFSKFLFLLSVWVVFPALLATYLFYHTCLPLSTRNVTQYV